MISSSSSSLCSFDLDSYKKLKRALLKIYTRQKGLGGGDRDWVEEIGVGRRR